MVGGLASIHAYVPSSRPARRLLNLMTGTLSVIYINRSIMECVDAATTRTEAATAGSAVCDLKADGRTLVLLLSVLTVRSCR